MEIRSARGTTLSSLIASTAFVAKRRNDVPVLRILRQRPFRPPRTTPPRSPRETSKGHRRSSNGKERETERICEIFARRRPVAGQEYTLHARVVKRNGAAPGVVYAVPVEADRIAIERIKPIVSFSMYRRARITEEPTNAMDTTVTIVAWTMPLSNYFKAALETMGTLRILYTERAPYSSFEARDGSRWLAMARNNGRSGD